MFNKILKKIFLFFIKNKIYFIYFFLYNLLAIVTFFVVSKIMIIYYGVILYLDYLEILKILKYKHSDILLLAYENFLNEKIFINMGGLTVSDYQVYFKKNIELIASGFQEYVNLNNFENESYVEGLYENKDVTKTYIARGVFFLFISLILINATK